MIVITGANGFIAKQLIKRLNDVVLFDMDNCERVFKEVDWPNVTKVYHLGAISDTTETDINKLHQYNVDFTIRLFKWASLDRGSIPIAYASSASVYGNGAGPLNYYAHSKSLVDLWVRDNLKMFQFIRGYRLFNVYGPGEEHKGNQASPIHQFVKQAKETGVIKIFEPDGDGERDFVYVGDVVDLMINDKRKSGIYDVGTGTPVKFSKVAELVAAKYGAKIETIPFPQHLKGKYQFHTQSWIKYDGFKSVEDYINELN